jgi:hypothetical protein
MQLYGDLDIRINRLRWTVMLIAWTINEWCIKFLVINLKEVGQDEDPNPDGGTVCMVI